MNNKNETYEFDAIIIGAGIVGLAIAHELSAEYENILVIEKEITFGRHVSSRNLLFRWLNLGNVLEKLSVRNHQDSFSISIRNC